MISKTLQNAICDQVNKEFYSSYLYLAMSAWAEEKNLPGLATWLKVQADEERGHGMKLWAHLTDRGSRVNLGAIAAPPAEWPSALALFKEVLAHEGKITQSIHKLYELALSEKDYPAQLALAWFVTEQVEEEKVASELCSQFERIEAHETAVLILDHQLAKRGKS